MTNDLERAFPDPRNEQEILMLFNDLLFMRFPREDGDMRGRHNLELNATGQKKLIASDMVNRIFREWYQTTWGNIDWHDDFGGSTARQELSVYRPDIGTGDAILSVQLEEKFLSPFSGDGLGGKRLEATPRIFTREELESAGGAFMYGLREIEKSKGGVVAPNYDPSFRHFAKHMQNVKKSAEAFASYELSDLPPETVYWRLFIAQAIAGIISFLPLSLDENQWIGLLDEMETILMGAMGLQKDREYDYIIIDTLFGYFWQAISRYDQTLIPYDEMMSDGPERLDRPAKDAKRAHSQTVLYRLGYAFDEYFLFPADRYWGAVEIVWQDQMTFLNNFSMAVYLLNHGKNSENMSAESDAEEYERLSIQRTVHSIDTMWFNPPTCFRVYDKALTII
ncbi:MAG: hypothetical protein ACYC4I_02305 [Minisyncoccota bacterium]